VLVIDDDEPLNRAICNAVRSTGNEPVGALSGEAGISAVDGKPPDLIILDLLLPGIDGMRVLDTLRRDPRTAQLPIVIHSSAVDPEPDYSPQRRRGRREFRSAKNLRARTQSCFWRRLRSSHTRTLLLSLRSPRLCGES